MKVTLCMPRPPVSLPGGGTVNSKTVYRFNLRWTAHHSSSHYGLGVLLDQRNQVFDGVMFRHLRDATGAWLEADDLERARAALGLPEGETIGRGADG